MPHERADDDRRNPDGDAHIHVSQRHARGQQSGSAGQTIQRLIMIYLRFAAVAAVDFDDSIVGQKSLSSWACLVKNDNHAISAADHVMRQYFVQKLV